MGINAVSPSYETAQHTTRSGTEFNDLDRGHARVQAEIRESARAPVSLQEPSCALTQGKGGGHNPAQLSIASSSSNRTNGPTAHISIVYYSGEQFSFGRRLPGSLYHSTSCDFEPFTRIHVFTNNPPAYGPLHFLALWNIWNQGPTAPHSFFISRGYQLFVSSVVTRSGCGIIATTRPSEV